MKFTTEIIVNLPLDKMMALFHDVSNLPKWQEGLVKYEQISGTPGEAGSKAALKFKFKDNRELELIETITVNDPPKEFSGTYESEGVVNEVKNYFEPVSATQTKWVSDCEFRFTGFMRFIAPLIPWVFKKQSFQIQQSFKKFAEGAK